MIIHIEICDVCGGIQHGIPVTGYYTEGSKITWDVGACCEQKPFTVVRETKERLAQMRTRIEALVATELRLTGSSA